MAGILVFAYDENVASGTAKKTILQVAAPTNQRVVIKSWGVSCQGTSGTAEPGIVHLRKQDSAGTSTTTGNKNMMGPGSETIQSTVGHTFTVEPTTDQDIYDSILLHPQSGYEKIYPPNQELVIPGGERVAITVTFAATVDVTAKIVFEE